MERTRSLKRVILKETPEFTIEILRGFSSTQTANSCIECGKPLPRKMGPPHRRCQFCNGKYNMEKATQERRREGIIRFLMNVNAFRECWLANVSQRIIQKHFNISSRILRKWVAWLSLPSRR